MNAGTKTKRDRCSPEYLSLVRAFPLRPIRGDDEHRRAIAVVDGFLDRPALTADEDDYLDVLGLLIADYEDTIYEHPDFTPVERLRHLMEEHSLTQAELVAPRGGRRHVTVRHPQRQATDKPQGERQVRRVLRRLGLVLRIIFRRPPESGSSA